MIKASTVAGALPFGLRVQEYEFLHVLGHGGFGITYLARDVNLGKTIAIKEYLPRELAVRGEAHQVQLRADDCREAFIWGLEQFLKEAQLLARFSHPNLIRIHRYFEAHGTAYIAMEYAEGSGLEEVLRRDGILHEEALLGVLIPVLNGLEQVHLGGVLHRDIKPGNIILRHSGEPVLIDFGAARLNLGSRTHSVLSMMTAGYAPIEQYAAEGKQGPWTDLYALAAVGYRAISGRRPPDAVNRIHEDPLVPAVLAGQGRYAPALLKALDWALAVNPEDRPRSSAEWRLAIQGQIEAPIKLQGGHRAPQHREVTEAVEAFPGPGGVLALDETQMLLREPQAPGTGDRNSGRRWALSAAIAGALVFAITGLVVQVRQLDSAAPPAGPAPAPARSDAPQSQPEAAAAEVREPTAPPQGQQSPSQPAVPAASRARQAKAPALTPVASMKAQQSFQDCPDCPRMVVLPAGSFQMGAAAGPGTNRWEVPQHAVRLARPFALGAAEITVAEWQACVAAKACAPAVNATAADHPVTGVNWAEAGAYATWLAKRTGRRYRLPSEAEWEYAVRAGGSSARFWGETREGQCRHANAADLASLPVLGPDSRHVDCNDGHARIAPIRRYAANAFGLYDMAGNVWEWTLDCWRDSYAGAPVDGSPVPGGDCERRVIRGGSWRSKPESLRSAARGFSPVEHRSDDLGLRLVAE